jgi:hypothetical protein
MARQLATDMSGPEAAAIIPNQQTASVMIFRHQGIRLWVIASHRARKLSCSLAQVSCSEQRATSVSDKAQPIICFKNNFLCQNPTGREQLNITTKTFSESGRTSTASLKVEIILFLAFVAYRARCSLHMRLRIPVCPSHAPRNSYTFRY